MAFCATPSTLTGTPAVRSSLGPRLAPSTATSARSLSASSSAAFARPDASARTLRQGLTRVVASGRRALAAGPRAAGGDFDYDLIIIGAGVGGHGAALHAVEQASAYTNSPLPLHGNRFLERKNRGNVDKGLVAWLR